MKITRRKLRKLIIEAVNESAMPMPSSIEKIYKDILGELTKELEKEAAEYAKECMLESIKKLKIPNEEDITECVIGKFGDNAAAHVTKAVDTVVEMFFSKLPAGLGDIAGELGDIAGDLNPFKF